MNPTRSHARLDRTSRELKAERIASLLEAWTGPVTGKRVLDVGTGSGVIASQLAARGALATAVDVVDERVVQDVPFQLVGSEDLPFEDASFDLVVSNHVIEHVARQERHLAEVRRVLCPGGACYLATPNRFAVLEPHYRLPLLSWLPSSLAGSYLRLVRRADRYDVVPLTRGALLRLASTVGLETHDRSLEVARYELGRRLGRPVRPPGFVKPLLPAHVLLLVAPTSAERTEGHAR